jgi:hypothetical protein
MSKLIEFLGLEEYGTNLPPYLFDPKKFPKEAYYDDMGKYTAIRV